MSKRDRHVKELSTTLRGMKFMARLSGGLPEPVVEKEGAWSVDTGRDRTRRVDHDASFMSFLDFPVVGRQSFQDFNSEVEKMQQGVVKDVEMKKSEVREKKAMISDKEMAEKLAKNTQETTKKRKSDAAEKKDNKKTKSN